jgi:plastocyanin
MSSTPSTSLRTSSRIVSVRRALAGPTLGALLLALAAGSARAEVIEIKAEKLVFAPAQVSAHVGDTIVWMNADFVAHTATARNGAWDVMLPPNAKKQLVLKSAGTLDYYFTEHDRQDHRRGVKRTGWRDRSRRPG